MERAIEWNIVCDYATSYEVTDETNMVPAQITPTPPTGSSSRNSNGFHANGFYDLKLRNVSTACFHAFNSVPKIWVPTKIKTESSFYESTKYETILPNAQFQVGKFVNFGSKSFCSIFAHFFDSLFQ